MCVIKCVQYVCYYHFIYIQPEEVGSAEGKTNRMLKLAVDMEDMVMIGWGVAMVDILLMAMTCTVIHPMVHQEDMVVQAMAVDRTDTSHTKSGKVKNFVKMSQLRYFTWLKLWSKTNCISQP